MTSLDAIVIRAFHPADAEELTSLLHRAYKPLAEAGMRYHASWQDSATTIERATADGAMTLLATLDGRIVGTLTLMPPHPNRGDRWYARDDVVVLGQYAVEPELQRCGVGRLLGTRASKVAADLGAVYLAIDTSERATDLIALYARHGFTKVDETQFAVTNYRSVIMVKRLR